MQLDKKKRVESNKKNQMRNLKLAQGPRLAGGQIDMQSAVNKGKQLKTTKGNKSKKNGHLKVSFDIASQSTASLGQFDKRSSPLEKDQSVKLRPKVRAMVKGTLSLNSPKSQNSIADQETNANCRVVVSTRERSQPQSTFSYATPLGR